MNLLTLIPGLIGGGGVALIVLSLIPRQPQLSAALDRIGETARPENVEPDTSLQHRVGSWMERHVPDRSWLKVPTTDLRLIGMSKALAYEVASRNITVNTVAPGFIGSAMTEELNDKQKEAILGKVPAGRLGSAEEVAAAVVFLASTESGYITGHTLNVNGGMVML